MHESIRKARETLARRKDQEAEFEAYNARREYTPLVRERPAPIRSTPIMTDTPEPDWSGWESWINGHLENFAEMLGQELSASDRAVNLGLESLEQKLGELLAEREVERAAKVIDLPDFRKKRSNAT